MRLISVGPTTNEALLPRLPGLIAATSAVSCSYALPESFDFGQCVAAAECVLEIAARTNGAGNFRWGAACHPSRRTGIASVHYFLHASSKDGR